MVYRGHVENGIIQLEHSTVLPEGSEVYVQLMPPSAVCRNRSDPGTGGCRHLVGCSRGRMESTASRLDG